VSLKWGGRDIYAKSGEWIVSLDRPEPVFSPEGELIDLKIEWAGPNDKAPELQAQFDRSGLGLKFGRFLGSKDAILIDVPLGVTYDRLRTVLGAVPGFLNVAPNAVDWAGASTPNDTRYGEQYGLNNTGQTGGTSDADIDAAEAWDLTRGFSGTVIGVIDTGINFSHPDLAANVWTNPGEIAGNGLDDDQNGYTDDVHGWDFVNQDADPSDDNGHGTATSGVIAAVGDNGVGVTGVAWNARILPLKAGAFDGSFSIDAETEAIRYATRMRNVAGVNIRATNNSYGGYTNDLERYRAINESGDAGMIFVGAAGNDHNDNDVNLSFPASHNLPNIISVAATDHDDAFASAFSNFGATTVDLAAPGDDVLTTVLTSGGDPNLRDASGYRTLDGTSFAAPMVTGAAALAFSLKPNATYQEVRDAILNGVDAKSTLAGKVATGGRLNVFNTLQLLNPASITVNGDANGAPTADTILVRVDPANSANVQVLRNSVLQVTRAISGVTRIDLNGLFGNDTISVDSAISIPVWVTGGSGGDNITGGGGNDTLDGGANSDSIVGYLGDDSLLGQSGNDTLIGQGGNDTMSGGAGADSLGGGGGSDWVDYQEKTANLSISLDGVANDGETGLTGGAQFVGTNAASFEKDNADADVENIIAGRANDYVGGNAAANTLYGERGNDILEGGAGADVFNGGYGQDMYYAQDSVVENLQNFDGDNTGLWSRDNGPTIFDVIV
jgi:subtilisin family serine protease